MYSQENANAIVRIAESAEKIVMGQTKIINALAEIKELLKPENKEQEEACVYDATYQIKRMKQDRNYCTSDNFRASKGGHC